MWSTALAMLVAAFSLALSRLPAGLVNGLAAATDLQQLRDGQPGDRSSNRPPGPGALANGSSWSSPVRAGGVRHG
jgi:hypothetical protein